MNAYASLSYVSDTSKEIPILWLNSAYTTSK